MNEKPRKWWVSFLLSLLQPGLGQIYNGQALKGFIVLFITTIYYPLIILPSLAFYRGNLPILTFFLLTILIYAVFSIAVIVDAIYQSKKLNKSYQLKKYNSVLVYICIILCMYLLPRIIPSLDSLVIAKQIRDEYICAYRIPSTNMEPTILKGDHILVDVRNSAKNPLRGDLIVFEYPKDSTKDFLERVEAVGKDTVEIRNKELYVNNKIVKEIQAIHKEKEIIPANLSPRDNFGPVIVPDDSYFVMGDNRDNSLDSRFWGFVPKSKIKGTAKRIYWSRDDKTSKIRWERIFKELFFGNFNQAIADYNKAIELNPKDAKAYISRGIAYDKLGNYDQAIANFNKAIELNPKDAKAYYSRGNTYLNLGNYNQAIADYNKAIEIDPQNADVYYYRGLTYRYNGDYNRSITDYNKAIELDPKHADAYNSRGVSYDKLGNYNQAITDYNKAIELDPKMAKAYNNRGIIYENRGNHNQAIVDYNKAIELNPKFAIAYCNRGNAYRNLGNDNQAIADYNKTIELNPKDATAYYSRGNAYHKLGNTEEALSNIKIAARLGYKAAQDFLSKRGVAW